METILKVDNINVYYGSIHAIKGVSFEVSQGEIVTLIGANGAGKSTTLTTISGLLRSKTGSVTFLGEDLGRVPAHKVVSRGLALVPEGRRIFLQMTTQENLEMGAYTRSGKPDPADLEKVYDQFPRLKERRKQVAGTLSGGEQFLASLSLAFGLSSVVQGHSGAVGLDSIFIDEGFGSLDGTTLDTALSVLQQLTEGNCLVGIISHVGRLEESIPQQIRVKNGEKGSSLEIVC